MLDNPYTLCDRNRSRSAGEMLHRDRTREILGSTTEYVFGNAAADGGAGENSPAPVKGTIFSASEDLTITNIAAYYLETSGNTRMVVSLLDVDDVITSNLYDSSQAMSVGQRYDWTTSLAITSGQRVLIAGAYDGATLNTRYGTGTTFDDPNGRLTYDGVYYGSLNPATVSNDMTYSWPGNAYLFEVTYEA